MLSLNQLKQILVNFLNSHAQINEVVWGDDFEFSVDRDLNYPVASIEYLDTNINGKAMNHNFKVVLGDLSDPNVHGIDDEVVSDMLLVADDVMSWLQQQEGFQFIKSSNIQKFTDEFGDRVSGVVFRIVLSVIRRQNECAIPTKANEV